MIKRLTCIFSAIVLLFATHASYASNPKYIFMFIGDGMGWGHITLTQNWLKSVDNNPSPLLMTTFPNLGACTTHPSNGPITDSAAAGTALASGNKTKKGMLGVDSDTVPVTSIASKLKNKGYGVALITTVAQDDATPGAFYAHVPNRNMFKEIDIQAAKSNFDFIAGASLRGRFDKNGQSTGVDKALADNGWSLVEGIENISKARTPKIMLVADDAPNDNSVGYVVDTKGNGQTIEAMTKAGLKHMHKVSPNSFFMMVEGGNIDHASHSNDGVAVVNEIKAFNNALKTAYDFYLAHSEETLIIVTADHNTGGLSVGNEGTGSNAFIEKARGQNISKEAMTEKIKKMLKSEQDYGWEVIKEMLQKDLGIGSTFKISAKDEERLRDVWKSTFVDRTGRDVETLYASFDPLTTTAFKILDKYSGIGWTSAKHTANLVPVMTIGVGAEKFKGIMDNTDIPPIVEKLTSEQ